jgi:hypothetical protein
MILTDYLINGQQLTGERSSLIVGTTHFTSISPRIDSVTVNGRSGVMLPAGPVAFDAPEITLKFITGGLDADTLMHRFYRLCRLASELTRVERDVSTGLTRRMTAKAVCTSCQPDGDEIPWSNHRAATAVFQLLDVFWQGDWQIATLPAVGGVLIHGKAKPGSEGWYSNAPLLNLILRFSNVSSVTVTDQVTGTDIKWSGPNASNLYLDAGNRRAWTAGGNNAWTGGTDVTSGVNWTSEPLQVWPAVDSCSYSLQVKQSGASAVTCRYKPSWE